MGRGSFDDAWAEVRGRHRLAFLFLVVSEKGVSKNWIMGFGCD